ncbi:hypothetical protein J6S88_00995 [bacterium]|nr:hypothetical protein [bacterium]
MNINEKFKEYAELKIMEEELKAEMDKIKKEITDYMESEQMFEIQGLEHKCSWKEVVSYNLDRKELKKQMADIYNRFLKESKTRKFLFQ